MREGGGWDGMGQRQGEGGKGEAEGKVGGEERGGAVMDERRKGARGEWGRLAGVDGRCVEEQRGKGGGGNE